MRVILGTWGRRFVRADPEAVYIDFGRFDHGARVYHHGSSACLTPAEMATAGAILSMRGGIATHEALLFALWGDRDDGGPLTMPRVRDQHVLRLRKKLAPLGIAIYTEWGVGYSCSLVEPFVFKAAGKGKAHIRQHPGMTAQKKRLPHWVHGGV